jgi:hypothetical protein
MNQNAHVCKVTEDIPYAISLIDYQYRLGHA